MVSVILLSPIRMASASALPVFYRKPQTEDRKPGRKTADGGVCTVESCYPNAAGDTRNWNTGIDPGAGSTADDITFLRDLIAKLEGEYKIDGNRIYATGLSNGAAMCHHIAALMPDKIAAVAPVEGAVGMSPDGVQPFKIQTTPTKSVSIAII